MYKTKNLIYSLLIPFLTLFFYSCEESIYHDNLDKLSLALRDAAPGDTFLIKNGIYRDVSFLIFAKGSAEKPIIVAAETPGGVSFEGFSNVRIAGEYVELHNLYFKNGSSPEGAVIEYRSGDEIANNCRVTGCAIEYYNPKDRATENAWIKLYGKNNRFDHNTIFGKQNGEATLIVELNEEQHRENRHSIDHNFFGIRSNYGSNGAETIRVGNSTYSLTSSQTQIVDNWFEHCNGEAEHVSIKSCDNYIARNVFYECAGGLVLRHGNRNTVEENVFIGNKKPHTGGIRIVNEDQIIRKNYLKELTGRRFYAALAVMNGVPNPLINRYHQVKNTQIIENIFVDCDHIEFCVGSDNERTLTPVETVFKDNMIINQNAGELYINHDDISGIQFLNNRFNIGNKSIRKEGFIYEELSAPPLQMPIERDSCGAPWFKFTKKKENIDSPKTIVVENDTKQLSEIIKEANPHDTILLKISSEMFLEEPLEIDKSIVILSHLTGDEKPILRYSGSGGQNPIIRIADGGKLKIAGIVFDGLPVEGRSKAFAGVATADIMSGTYSATIDNCEFKNFEESSFAGFKALKNTFADSLTFNNCIFYNISGDGISLSAEKEDVGKYSAENVMINNCHFEKILGTAVNIYRGGNDESTTGPSVYIMNSNFIDSSNQERGSALRLIGVQTARISNLTFINSGRGGASIKFDECSWDDIQMNNIVYKNSGKLRMNSLYR